MVDVTRPRASVFDAVLQRMYQRGGVDILPADIERTYGITITKVSRLDVGVFRVDRSDKGVPLVARLFSAARSHAAAEADLAVLRYLAEIGFRAERPFGDGPLTTHEGQALLVTEFVRQVPNAKRPAFPILSLGAMVGRLHRLAVPVGADRPAGALHHLAEETMADELRAVAEWLDSIEPRLPRGGGDAFDTLRTAGATLTVEMAYPRLSFIPIQFPRT